MVSESQGLRTLVTVSSFSTQNQQRNMGLATINPKILNLNSTSKNLLVKEGRVLI